jgi:hypothetical protein
MTNIAHLLVLRNICSLRPATLTFAGVVLLLVEASL